MLKYIQSILRKQANDDLGYYFIDLLDYREIIKYNPKTDRFEISRQKIDAKIEWAFKLRGYYDKKPIEGTNVYVQMDTYILTFWLE